MKKRYQSKVEYILAEKMKCTKNAVIAETMDISVRYVQKLWARFKNTPKDKIVFPAPMGRPRKRSSTRNEQSIGRGTMQSNWRGKLHMEPPRTHYS